MSSPEHAADASASTSDGDVPSSILDYYRLEQLQDLIELADNLAELLAEDA